MPGASGLAVIPTTITTWQVPSQVVQLTPIQFKASRDECISSSFFVISLTFSQVEEKDWERKVETRDMRKWNGALRVNLKVALAFCEKMCSVN